MEFGQEHSREIFIWGAGGHALVVADVARLLGWHILGFLDAVSLERQGSEFAGSIILGGVEQLSAIRKKTPFAFVAVGDCTARLRIAESLAVSGFQFPVLCHPRAVVANDVVLGAGTLIAAGAVVNSQAVLGTHCLINTLSSVDHECELGDGVHVCPGVHLAGRVRVGTASMLGIGSVVREGISIGRGVKLGAGSVVVSDLPASVTAFGVPAKVQVAKDAHRA